ncbi:bacteriohemerythrin [Kineothrix sp. MB12-C1]|uniref:bacteriohemerythrin n=1 Tax=Kineothrix sp. MB12-C1 TaxID=3070215 RepID=UPI0027D32CB3|nr:hemerythrin family protein [Kineothrix sp. MB12-C1]WMC91480.1 hemerythrin family protein [Kineothrix sp. MB12-C1]
MIWKEKYNLGVTLIDEQHQELFKRVDAFVQTLRSSASWEEKVKKVNDTLEFMNGYVVEHFKDEEEYQRRIGYPGYEEHKKVHDDMVSYVVEITAEYEKSGYNEQLMQQFGGKLLSWLINHVAAQDQKIADYAIEKGVAEDGR